MLRDDLELVNDLAPDLLRQAARLVGAEWWARHRPEERCLAAFARSRCYGLVDRSGRLVAFARFLDDGAFKALLLDLVLAPPLRGRGLGRRFLEAILARPELAAIDHVELYCEPALEGYYGDLGFSRRAGGALFMRLERRPSPETPTTEEKT